MGTTLLELFPFRLPINFFNVDVRLRFSWLATLTVFPAKALWLLFLQPIAFRPCLLQHYLTAVPSVDLSVLLPGRSVFQNIAKFISCDLDPCNMGHFRLFSFEFSPRGLLKNFRFLFPLSLTQPLNERLAFFRVNWMIKFPCRVQTLTLPLRKPEGLIEPVHHSAKNLFPSPLLQSNLLSLTWYPKDTLERLPDANIYKILYKRYINLGYKQFVNKLFGLYD